MIVPLIGDEISPVQQEPGPYEAALRKLATDEPLSRAERDAILHGTQHERRRHEQNLELARSTNTLTGLPNDVALERDLGHAIATTTDEYRDTLVAILDLDKFKTYNDKHGHGHGDLLLKAFSRYLLSNIRHGDRAYRTGGDEFAVLAYRSAGLEFRLPRIAHGLRGAMQHIDPEGIVGVSIGATIVRPDDTPLTARTRADDAMYHAKLHGLGMHLWLEGVDYESTHDQVVQTRSRTERTIVPEYRLLLPFI